jgi:hypothetical protein
MATASSIEVKALRDAILKHLALQTSLQVNIPVSLGLRHLVLLVWRLTNFFRLWGFAASE